MRGGVDPVNHRFRPRGVEVADVRKDFCPGDDILSFPGAAGPRRYSEG